MSKNIQKTIGLQQALNNYRPFNPTLLSTIQERLRIEWTYNSNALEGNTLTFGETAFFLREGLTSEGKPLKDYLEAQNHAQAIEWLHLQINENRQLTESFIKELHSLLLSGIKFTYAKGQGGQLVQKPLTPGKYKLRPNHVLTLSGTVHHYTDPLHVKYEMEKLVKWLKTEKSYHCIEKAAIFHYKFVAIHPFDDGNGRMARLLMNLILMRNGFPPCIIKNTNRRKYLQSLAEVDKTQDFSKFIEFIATELLATQQTIYDTIQGRSSPVIEDSRLTKEEREALIVKIVNDSGTPLPIGRIQSELPQIKRPTLKSDLQNLVNQKKIQAQGVKKGVKYYAL